MADFLLQVTSISDAEFARISEFVKGVCGINLHTGKKELVKARLAKRIRELDLHSFDDYFDYVHADASGVELTVMLDRLSTNLTYFFREAQHFALIPKLVADSAATKKVRVWSAGCSSGEEAYTLAICLAEATGSSGYDTKVLATDISTRVLDTARKGVYHSQRLREVPGGLMGRHFTMIQARPDRVYRVNDEIRSQVTFGRLNLMENWPMSGPFDAIFCRNVMIYFDKPTQARLVDRFERLLRPGGMLFVGHSESLAGVSHTLGYVQPAAYRRK
ncbi:MAG: protein-glutamate O-methyltransferase CheR [Planctomycetota bacterium]|jgi:chemotaxis protein methyltransferase CheR